MDGGVIARIPTGASFTARFKHPYIVIHRVDLHHILLDACKANSDIELMPLTNVIGYEDLGDRVRLPPLPPKLCAGVRMQLAILMK
jgi:2-polyprenyl-6-methoxyphenol hydroxylase-like FAD-dependent oxidoreductase